MIGGFQFVTINSSLCWTKAALSFCCYSLNHLVLYTISNWHKVRTHLPFNQQMQHLHLLQLKALEEPAQRASQSTALPKTQKRKDVTLQHRAFNCKTRCHSSRGRRQLQQLQECSRAPRSHRASLQNKNLASSSLHLSLHWELMRGNSQEHKELIPEGEASVRKDKFLTFIKAAY